MAKQSEAFMPNNCPIRERTADGVNVGRCWFGLKDGICPRHGDVRAAVKIFKDTGKLVEDPRRSDQ
jgi:hypothetical protein